MVSKNHKKLQLMAEKRANVSTNQVINYIVVGAMVGIGIPILYGFFTEWATNTDMPTWLTTAGPAFLGLGVLILVVGLARARK